MIVLKATQDKVLAVLQSVAGILERRRPPTLANVLIRRTGQLDTLIPEICVSALEVLARHSVEALTSFVSSVAKLKHALGLNLPRTSYFSSKVNGRNAP